jgi:t-SNARE complex subunit (syntaxin)
VEALQAKVNDQAQEIEELASVIAKLQDQLDFKKRYHSTNPYNFKTWLRRQSGKTPFMQKILDYPFEKEKTSRHNYEEKLRRQLHCTEEEMRDFHELWIQMLLSQT